ncbi:unnamed protein product [Mytilus coruscus]|uniref:Reverse transcriptase RNase H-like domain-containing protein n=1 Tax=Mytilus coruscus TaxID=42192 RepID=A0A6J8A311_MYTCO|nr:unnamed protein product [Mytilus coruscus]
MVFDEVVFWKENIEFLNGKELLDKKICTSLVYTNASGTGFGGYIVDCAKSEVKCSWKLEEQVNSSTWCKLESVYRMLMSKLTYMKGQKVLWRTYNQNVVHILYKGSVKSDLQRIAINIADICTREEIQLSRIKLGQTIEDDILAAGVTSDNFSTLDNRMEHFLSHSRSDNTTKLYHGAFRRFGKFIISKGGVAIPVEPIHVSLYLTKLLGSV